jgi:hypothetical protein
MLSEIYNSETNYNNKNWNVSLGKNSKAATTEEFRAIPKLQEMQI